MKRTGRILTAVSLALVTVLSLMLLASANATLKPIDYSQYGQVKLSGYKGGTEPTLDGVFSADEYENVYEQKDGTPGFYYSSDAAKSMITNIKFGITVTDASIYLGVVVTEPYYRWRGTAGGNSYMTFSFGFNMGDKFYQCMDRHTITMSILEDQTIQKVDTVLTYDENGKYNGTNAMKYDGTVFEDASYKRNSDNTTVYEIKLSKEKLIAAQKGYDSTGALMPDYHPYTSIGDEFYVYYDCKGYDANGSTGNAMFRTLLSDEAKNAIKDADGWVATFAPHILSLTDKPAPTTDPVTTTDSGTAAGTEASGTTSGSTTNPVTGDSTVFIAFAALLCAAVPAAVIVLKKKD